MADASELRTKHVEALGPELGTVYHALWQEQAWLRAIWQEFEALVGSDPSKVELLNRAAPFFFRVVQDELWRSVLLRIRRLTDPPKSAGKENLTITRLPALCEEPLRSRLQLLVDDACQAGTFAREVTNRTIAHADLEIHLGIATEPLPVATKLQTEGAISAIHSVLNCISGDLMDCELSEELVIGPNRAEALLFVLADGLLLRDYRRRNRGQNDLPKELRDRPRF